MSSITDHRGRATRLMSRLSLFAALAIPLPAFVVGCGDNEGSSDREVPDAGKVDSAPSSTVDASESVEELDAAAPTEEGQPEEADAETPEEDAEAAENEPDAADTDASVLTPAVVREVYFQSKALSADQSDRLVAAAFGPDGKIYAAGYVTDAVPNTTFVDRKLAVARFNVDGSTDMGFGVDGVASLNAVVASSESDTAETAKGVAVQSDGKVVVVGTVATSRFVTTVNHTNPTTQVVTPVTGAVSEVDIVVARFTAAGVLDSSTSAGNTGFSVANADGRDGVLSFSLGAVLVTANASTATPPVYSLSAGNDDVGGLAVDSKDRIVLFARAKAPGARTDFDRYILRLTRDGAFDSTFASNGQYVYSSEGAYSENARSGTVLPDDGIVSAGYTNINGKNTIVIARVDANGRMLSGFGNYGGGAVINPFINTTTPADSGFCEAYAAAVQSDGKIVTTGYGKVLPSEAQNSMLSVRLDTNGAVDSVWGNHGYYTELNVLNGGANPAFGPEQGRNAVALADDRILMVGNGTPEGGPKGGDGVVVVLSKEGAFDTSFQLHGHKTYDLGLSGDQLWGAAVSKDGKYAAVVGYSAATTAAPASERVADENSALIVYKIGD